MTAAPMPDQPDQAWSQDKKHRLPPPTEDHLAALVKAKWLEAKPSSEAQRIRAALHFDSGTFSQEDSDFMPDYVWDIADIAAQLALNTTKRGSGDLLVRNLAMLVFRLSHRLGLREDGKSLSAEAMSFLERNDLIGSYLRDEAEPRGEP